MYRIQVELEVGFVHYNNMLSRIVVRPTMQFMKNCHFVLMLYDLEGRGLPLYALILELTISISDVHNYTYVNL